MCVCVCVDGGMYVMYKPLAEMTDQTFVIHIHVTYGLHLKDRPLIFTSDSKLVIRICNKLVIFFGTVHLLL